MCPLASANTDPAWSSTSRSSSVSRTAHGSTAKAGCEITPHAERRLPDDAAWVGRRDATTALETLPSSIERRPVSPREPMTIVAASWRSASSRIVFQTGPVALTASGSAFRPASWAKRTPSSATRPAFSAAARSSSATSTMLAVSPDQAKLPRPASGCHTITTSALLPANKLARALDRVPGVLGSVVTEQQRAVGARRAPLGIDGVGRDRQAEAVLDVLDELSLLPVGVLGAAQRDQDVVGREVRDGVRDDGQDAATAGNAAGVGADRAHVAEHGVEALIGDMPQPIDIVGQPREPTRQGGRERRRPRPPRR